MKYSKSFRAALLSGAVLAAGVLANTTTTRAADSAARPEPAPLAKAVSTVTRSTEWKLAQRIGLDFDTHHPQGFARAGDRLFLSSVEIIEPPVKHRQPVDGHDRTPGKGRGHLFVLDLKGNLIKDIVLGEGDMYHPGGIDVDEESLWIPLAEYRPHSRSIIYRVDLRTLEVSEEFRVADHIGGIVPDPASGRLSGVTWGSREFYTWSAEGKQLDHTANSSHFIDYQDCARAGRDAAVCTGITGYEAPDGTGFELGGIALLDTRTQTVRHEVPVQLWSAAGHVVTRNPVHLEADGSTLRMWAAPDDGEETAGTEILVYESKVG
ncbi:MAG TPA: hypothetical protein DEQ61_12740 [Streptomyces sp.]|nr:hypothetical protein [Streptomyces sp.]